MHRVVRRGAMFGLVVVLAGCATPTPRATSDAIDLAYDRRAESLGDWTDWALTGRLGLSKGEDGGSGRLDWQQAGASAELRFRGTLGRGAWKLNAAPAGARLELASGEVRESDRVEDLVYGATGWSVPVTALGWWVRGLAWPEGEAPTQIALNEDGTPEALTQDGWVVNFTRYAEGPDEELMPTRLQAEKDGLVVKLAVSRWSRGSAGSADDG